MHWLQSVRFCMLGFISISSDHKRTKTTWFTFVCVCVCASPSLSLWISRFERYVSWQSSPSNCFLLSHHINTHPLFSYVLQEARRLAIVQEAKMALAARRIQSEWRMHVEYAHFWKIKGAVEKLRIQFFIRCIVRFRFLRTVSFNGSFIFFGLC